MVYRENEMLRRRFIQLMTVASAGGSLGALSTLEAGDTETITYRVKGFTCVTCAVGLETLLRKEKGVVWVRASYPEASVIIRYQPTNISEDQVKKLIADLGFTPELKHQG
jgi:Cu+-exporting ATPase